jgi:HJR/Mrr/RecB family endonuclease
MNQVALPALMASAAARGRAFEAHAERVLRVLFVESLGGSIISQGGAHDRGIDLIARLPPVTLLVQCKHVQRRLGPGMVREMEASVQESRVAPKCGMLIASHGFTQHALERALVAQVPLILAHLEPGRDLLRSVVPNGLASAMLASVGSFVPDGDLVSFSPRT